VGAGQNGRAGVLKTPGQTGLIANKGDCGWVLLLTIEGQQEQGHPAA